MMSFVLYPEMLRGHSKQCPMTMCFTRDQIWVKHMQGKYPNNFMISLDPKFTFYKMIRSPVLGMI